MKKNLKESIIFGIGCIAGMLLWVNFQCQDSNSTEQGLNFSEYNRVIYIPLGEINNAEIARSSKTFIKNATVVDTVTVLYRVSSREVLDISVKGNPFTKANAKYFSRTINPVFLDGLDETIPKIILLGGANPDTIRNATAEEELTFKLLRDQDLLDEELDGINRRLDNDPQFRKFVKALVKLLVKEFNRSRTVDGANTITNEQAFNALKNELNKND